MTSESERSPGAIVSPMEPSGAPCSEIRDVTPSSPLSPDPHTSSQILISGEISILEKSHANFVSNHGSINHRDFGRGKQLIIITNCGTTSHRIATTSIVYSFQDEEITLMSLTFQNF